MPEASRLRELLVHSQRRIGPGGARALAESASLAGLTSLAIVQGGIGGGGVRALTSSPGLRSLTKLTLPCNDLEDDSALVLAESSLLPRLRVLNVGWNQFGAAGAVGLVMSPACAGLERLDLEDNNLAGPEVARGIAEAAHLRRLRELNLGHSGL